MNQHHHKLIGKYMKPLIVVENLVKTFPVPIDQSFFKKIFFPKYETFTAVSDISFAIGEGESVALLGPNGAGKTTTLKMLTGILHPTSGTVSLMGFTPTQRKYSMLRDIGFVMGNKSTLSTDLSAMQNYELNRVVYGIEPNHFYQTIDELAELLDVTKHLNKQIRKLSLGQRMKVEIIGSILHQPKILFLDEPTIGLDISSQNSIRNFLNKIHKELGTTIILTSHNMEDIEQVSNRVIIINQGRLVFDNSLELLKRNFSNNKFIKIIFDTKIDDSILEEVTKYGKITEKNHDSLILEVDRTKQSTAIASILNLPHMQDLDIQSIPLSKIIEEVFKK
jgi:ABC-2 type transport system ATP-binding protein